MSEKSKKQEVTKYTFLYDKGDIIQLYKRKNVHRPMYYKHVMPLEVYKLCLVLLNTYQFASKDMRHILYLERLRYVMAQYLNLYLKNNDLTNTTLDDRIAILHICMHNFTADLDIDDWEIDTNVNNNSIEISKKFASMYFDRVEATICSDMVFSISQYSMQKFLKHIFSSGEVVFKNEEDKEHITQALMDVISMQGELMPVKVDN